MARIRVLIRSKGPHEPLYLYYVDPDTHRERARNSFTNDRGEAERAAARWEEELVAHRGADGTSWEWFVERFETEHLAALPKKNRVCYLTALKHFRRIVKIDDLSRLDASAVSTFKAAMMGEKFPQSSIGTYLTHLRSAFNWAARVGMLRKSPSIEMPKRPKRKLMRGRPVTETEYLAMRKLAEPWMQRVLDCLWLSGLRLNEARKLSWDSPPLQLLVDSKPYPQLLFFAEGHKAGDDDATPVTPDFHAWLLKTPPEARHGLVMGPTNSRLGINISALGEAAGVVVSDVGRKRAANTKKKARTQKFASAHDFRRAFGTRWAMKVRPVTLQRLMRHKSIETTLRYYVGLSVADAGAEIWGDSGSEQNGKQNYTPDGKDSKAAK